MISKAKAHAILFAALEKPQKTETIDLVETLGRVLAEDVIAVNDVPPFDRSAMDGYACRAEDIAKAPVELDVLGVVPAGETFAGEPRPGACVKIMTGAPVPAGFDCVQMVEKTEDLGGDRVRIEAAVPEGKNVANRGEDMREGEVVLARGTVLRPLEVGMLSTLSKPHVEVFRRPRVTVFATGDELVPPGGGPLGPGQIRESNGAMLTAQVSSLGLGIDARFGGIVKDRPEATSTAIDQGLGGEVMVLSGGVSMGDYDFVHKELKARGLEVMIERVRMKPGKPLLFGSLPKPDGGSLWVFGLPGNPVSSFCTFELFVRPFLRGLCGYVEPHFLELDAEMAEETRGRALPRMQHLPARVVWEDGRLRARAVRWNGSGDLRGMMDANAFIIVPQDEPPAEVGAMTRVHVLEPDSLRLPRHLSRGANEQ